MSKYFGRNKGWDYSYAKRIPRRYKVAAGIVGIVCGLVAAAIVNIVFDKVERFSSKRTFTQAAREAAGPTAPVLAGLPDRPIYAPIQVVMPKTPLGGPKPQLSGIQLAS